jgi:cytoskeletal protein CcmA (bactofilin family)
MSLFPRKKDNAVFTPERLQARVSSVLGQGIHWIGNLHGTGGVRIEGTMQGDIVIKGLVVIGETGKVICPELKAETVVVAGTMQGNITCQKLEIRSTGRVWGDVVAVSFSSEDGAFLRGQMRMEERVEIPVEEITLSEGLELPAFQNELPESTVSEPVQTEPALSSANLAPEQEASKVTVSETKKTGKPKLKSPWEK